MTEEHIEDLPLDPESAEGVVGGSTLTPKAPAEDPYGAGSGAPTASPTPSTPYAPKTPAPAPKAPASMPPI